jgi:hypothetical protein
VVRLVDGLHLKESHQKVTSCEGSSVGLISAANGKHVGRITPTTPPSLEPQVLSVSARESGIALAYCPNLANRRGEPWVVHSSAQALASPPTLGVATSKGSRLAEFPGRIHRATPSLNSLRIVRRVSITTRSHDDFFIIGK